MNTIALETGTINFDSTKYKLIAWLGGEWHMVRNLATGIRELWGYDSKGRKCKKKTLKN